MMRGWTCLCAECRALDAAHPGDGRQLALPIKTRSRPARRRATREAATMEIPA